MIDLRQGHTLERLREIPDGTANCIVTSPPYWGLRAYGTDPQVWLNGHEPCVEHQWTENSRYWDNRHASAVAAGLEDKGLLGGTSDARKGGIKDNTCSVCGAWRGELGLEPTPELYVEHLTQIFREARRVLRDDGTLWLNLGDSYAGSTFIREESSDGWANKGDGEAYDKYYAKNGGGVSGGKRRSTTGLKVKDLIGIPWRVAFALQADGWYLRQDIIWAKPNPMPESVRDRCTKAHEYVFLMSKSPRYYYDADAVKEPSSEWTIQRARQGDGTAMNSAESKDFNNTSRHDGNSASLHDFKKHAEGRNKRSVWTVTTHPFKEAHFATFPPKLIEPMILAGCPVGGTVLDPFNGSGTTGLVATQLGRNYIGIELKPEYIEMTKRRLENVQLKAAA